MKRILCFGDSITWGYDPDTGARFDEDTRWTGVLGRILGLDYSIIEEGLCGRTTVFNDPVDEHRNGLAYLKPCLASHAPIDLVILMLGINDVKATYRQPAFYIAKGMSLLVEACLTSGAGRDGEPPEVLVMPPVDIGNKITSSPIAEYFDSTSQEKCRQLKVYYSQLAGEYGCFYLNPSEFVSASETDSVHIDAEGHFRLATAVADFVRGDL